jgi:hypothetical protein
MSLLTDINKIKQYAKEKHEEVLKLIASLSDANSSDQASSVCSPLIVGHAITLSFDR